MTKKTQNNGIVSEYGYNRANIMDHYKSNGFDTTLGYTVDGLMQFAMNGANQVDTFRYDKAGRLVNEERYRYSGSVSSDIYNSYRYDSYGNRTKKIETRIENLKTTNTITTDYQYDLNNHLISSSCSDTLGNSSAVRYYYDKGGNQTAVQRSVYGSADDASGSAGLAGWGEDTGTGLYHYDAFNRLTEYITNDKVVNYTYGADNLRASKTVNGERTDFAWNGQNLAIEDTDGIINTYIYDPTGVHIANQNGKVVSYLKDWHNNIVGTVKPNGIVVESSDARQTYDSWGNILNNADFAPFGYTGEYHDSETGLIYLRNRYYDPETGRFITEDPIKSGMNWFVYAGNNPVMFVDPWGLEESGDKDVLSSSDYLLVQRYTKIYFYAKDVLRNNAIADQAHYLVTKIRQKDEYDWSDSYGPPRTTGEQSSGVHFSAQIGYIDLYDYSVDFGKAEFYITPPYSVGLAEFESGRLSGDLSNSGALGLFGNVADFIGGIVSTIDENIELYDKVFAGDVRIDVKEYRRNTESKIINPMEHVYSFYFHKNKGDYYYVRER